MRIAIVGNSHLAALRRALSNRRFVPDGVDLVLFGEPGRGFFDMAFRDGVLHLPDREFVKRTTDGRYADLPVAEFDAIVFHGGIENLSGLMLKLANSGTRAAGLSTAALAMLAKTWMDHCVPYHAVRQVRAAVGAPVIVSATPLFSAQSRRFDGTTMEKVDPIALRSPVLSRFAVDGISYLPQPAETLDGSYTRPEFSVATEVIKGRTDRAAQDADIQHMSDVYGALVLQDIAALLARKAAA